MARHDQQTNTCAQVGIAIIYYKFIGIQLQLVTGTNRTKSPVKVIDFWPHRIAPMLSEYLNAFPQTGPTLPKS